MVRDIPSVSPGEVLREEFLRPLGIQDILDGTDDVTPPIAEKLAHMFGTSAEFWLNLQSNHAAAR